MIVNAMFTVNFLDGTDEEHSVQLDHENELTKAIDAYLTGYKLSSLMITLVPGTED